MSLRLDCDHVFQAFNTPHVGKRLYWTFMVKQRPLVCFIISTVSPTLHKQFATVAMSNKEKQAQDLNSGNCS